MKAFITIAKALRMSVVAEGVQTQSEADFLLAHGCEKAQGYLFGKPVPAAVFERMWLETDEASMRGPQSSPGPS
ncbi:MAG: EAL domain-containing protein [Burkholderiales bacterium]|nr:EAL domain-containing protein [Burkholderiales bacterium]